MARRISLVDLSSRRRRTRRLLFWGGLVLAVGLLMAGGLWLVVRSSFFALKEIKVSGGTYVSAEEVREFLKNHVAQKGVVSLLGPGNILAWPKNLTEEELRDLPAVTFLRIEKSNFRRTVSVTVTERQRVGIWCFESGGSQRCFWFDPEGVLFMPAYSAEGNLTPVLHDYSRDPLSLGESALPAKFLPNLVSIFSALQSMHLSVKEVRLNDLVREEVEVQTYEGPRLLFSLRFPAAGVPAAIATVERMTKLQNLQYIDFRVENKVYYK